MAKKIEFRIIEHTRATDTKTYRVQVKTWLGWKYKMFGYMEGTYIAEYETEQACINRIYSDCKLKPSLISVIRYPNLIKL